MTVMAITVAQHKWLQNQDSGVVVW